MSSSTQSLGYSATTTSRGPCTTRCRDRSRQYWSHDANRKSVSRILLSRSISSGGCRRHALTQATTRDQRFLGGFLGSSGIFPQACWRFCSRSLRELLPSSSSIVTDKHSAAARLQLADIIVCSHPTLLCLLMAEAGHSNTRA